MSIQFLKIIILLISERILSFNSFKLDVISRTDTIRDRKIRLNAMNEIETVSNLCSSILIVDPTYNGAVWLKDMISVSALTCIGDGIAQTAQIISNYCDRFENRIKIQENSLPTNKWNNLSQNLKPSATVLLNSIYKEFDMNRFRNFAVFGFLDGAVSHSWFLLLDHFIKGHQLIDILARILADNLLYTSVWCAWFISAMALVEYIFTAEDKRPNLLEFNASKFLAEVLDLFKASFRYTICHLHDFIIYSIYWYRK